MKSLVETLNEGRAKFDKKFNALEWTSAGESYAILNTLDYPSVNGSTAVMFCEADGLEDAGFEEDAIERIKKMQISDVLTDFDYDGIIVVRMS